MNIDKIEFMVIGLPRSSTTWISNWLTTDTTICLHDPLWMHHYTEFNKIKTNKRLGIACTGLYKFPNWVNNHPARKVIIHRDLKEINDSLTEISLHQVTEEDEKKLWDIKGLHISQSDLYIGCPKQIYEFLINMPFDNERFELLKQINMQPTITKLEINLPVLNRIIKELGA